LNSKGVSFRTVKSNLQFHSGTIEAVNRGLIEAVRVQGGLNPSKTRLVSTLTCSDEPHQFATPEYWGLQASHPVNFHGALRALSTSRSYHFLEIGPRPVLSTLANSNKDFRDSHFSNMLNPRSNSLQLVADLMASQLPAGRPPNPKSEIPEYPLRALVDTPVGHQKVGAANQSTGLYELRWARK